MTSEMLYNYVTRFKNAFSIPGHQHLSCIKISLISDTGPILAIREPCPLCLFLFSGTPFMVRLQEQLQYFAVKKCSTDPLWQGVRVYLSGHEVGTVLVCVNL